MSLLHPPLAPPYNNDNVSSAISIDTSSCNGDSLADIGNAAAMELWDLIHAPKNRYGQAQRNRTLCHPRLRQPTKEQDALHLQQLNNATNNDTERLESLFSNLDTDSRHRPAINSSRSLVDCKNKTSLSLEERLATALQKAGLHRTSSTGVIPSRKQDLDDLSDLPSPTSTLQFPVSTEDHPQKQQYHPPQYDEPLRSITNTTHHINSTHTSMNADNGMQRNPSSSQDFFWEIQHHSNEDHHDDGYSFFSDANDKIIHSKHNSHDDEPIKHKPQNTHPNSSLPMYHTNHTSSTEIIQHSPSHSFVVCADTQLGMTSGNKEWQTELQYAHDAVNTINSLSPLPAFACVCGDLVDMEASFYIDTDKEDDDEPPPPFSLDQCHFIQDQQNKDFQRVWADLDDRIPLVCLCGNHDVGNRPTRASIDRFRSAFGDEYLAFWTNGSYNIVLNNVLFHDPSGAPDLFKDQLQWLEERLKYAKLHQATHIFVFGHHPWFLYDEHEKNTVDDMKGENPYPKEWADNDNDSSTGGAFPDFYFSISPRLRKMAMSLFKEYNVSAAFSGHFHQNLVSKSSFGMDMIITAPLSMVFESTGKPDQKETNGRGIRVVNVNGNGSGGFSHYFKLLGSEV